MISVSNAFKTALSQKTRVFDVKTEITRNDAGATPVDVSDRVVSYTISTSYESRNGRATINFDNYDAMLSQLNKESSLNQVGGVYDPLLDSEHTITISEGIKKADGSFEYITKFSGVLGDEIDADGIQVSVTARDRSKWLQDTYVYQSKTYEFYLVEDVIQDMINYFLPDKNITVQVETPTNFMIGRPDTPYTAKDTTLWDACQLLADTASQELMFIEDGTLILRKVELDFGNDIPDLALDKSSLVSNSNTITDSDVRNYIVLKVQGYDPIIKKNQPSIDEYGIRYMEVHRSMSDIITDVSDANELAENMLRDLSHAQPSATADIPLHPLIQIGDIITIDNNLIGINPTDDIFKVIGITESYSKDNKRTSLQLRGYDAFTSSAVPATKPPTSLTHSLVSRTISNYPNSGWSGSEKTIYFPMLKWTPPTQDVNGTALNRDFGGYVIFRKVMSADGTSLIHDWGAIASVKSYISALDLDVDYFYDYHASDHYQYSYKIYAVNLKGDKSTVSNTDTFVTPATTYS